MSKINCDNVSNRSVAGGHGKNLVNTEVIIATEAGLKKLFNRTLCPLFIMSFMCFIGPVGVWYTSTKLDGSYLAYYKLFRQEEGFFGGLYTVWTSFEYCSLFSLATVLGYMSFALMLMKYVPGDTVSGPVTPKGNMPLYVDNGFRCYIITMLMFVLVTAVLKWFGLTPTVVYDNFGEILCTLNIIGLLLCLFLYFKGLYFPNSSDHGASGNFIFDYYWGTELHPRLFDLDIKIFTNCRFGMTVWPIMCLIHALKSYELYGFVDSMCVSTILQLVYITKFFWWEGGYYSTIDIMLDRGGYYLCWGCLVIVPSLYPSVSLYLVNHPTRLGTGLSLFFLSAGMVSIAINYWADYQKQVTRLTDGNCTIWGRKPDIIRAEYTVSGTTQIKHSILLVSGFWGICRHFHYLPEIMLAFFWSVPALFENFQPYVYVCFLVVLLIHRTYRDDTKCLHKYGRYWSEYCVRVPYKIIPGIY